LHQLNHLELGSDETLRELGLLCVTTSCHSLPWLVAEAKRPDAKDIRGGLSLTAHYLQSPASPSASDQRKEYCTQIKTQRSRVLC
jgi:hypothetical protein